MIAITHVVNARRRIAAQRCDAAAHKVLDVNAVSGIRITFTDQQVAVFDAINAESSWSVNARRSQNAERNAVFLCPGAQYRLGR